jgi:hypothetical protein
MHGLHGERFHVSSVNYDVPSVYAAGCARSDLKMHSVVAGLADAGGPVGVQGVAPIFAL